MPPTRPLGAAFLAAILLLASASVAGAITANGRLQVVHLDVGQGDGAVIMSPLGQCVMIDDGGATYPVTPCSQVTHELDSLGITHCVYHFASHYHQDHIGCFQNVDNVVHFDLGFDRGESYTTGGYTTYANTLDGRRKTVVKGHVYTLDSLSAHPVTITVIDCYNLSGLSTSDENSKSVVLRVDYGAFSEVFGGDLQTSGFESQFGPEVGHVMVYKVHHHGSSGASSDAWLTATAPMAGIVSVGNGNTYGHPTSAALTRLHNHSVKTYWTERGAGATPNASWDKVAGSPILVSAVWQAGGKTTISGGTGSSAFCDTLTNPGTPTDTSPPVVSLTSPNGGEDWKAGSTHAISWTATDDVGVTTVDLAYSTNGGASFPNVIASGLANSGSYSWSVPNAPGTALRVRALAHDAAGNVGSDSSAANFTISTWTITASAGANGMVSPSGVVAVVQGASQDFTITPAAHYHVADVLADGASVGAVTGYTFSNVAANHTLAASFAIDTYTITASAGANGVIVPSGAIVVDYGGSQHFSIAPAVGAHLAGLTVDGTGVTPDTSYTFTSVTANHTIAASFAADEYAISVTTVGGGTVSKSPDQASYAYGASVLLTASPGTGWAFESWSGDTSGTADSLSLTVTQSRSVTATFLDIAPPAVTVTSPAGGESWLEGSAQEIRWTASDNAGVDSVNVDCSLWGAGGPWQAVAHGLTNTGSYEWTLPLSASDSALVRVTAYDAAGNAGVGRSDSVFAIVNPNAGVVGSGTELALWQPQPNPGAGTTLLRFTLPGSGRVRLEVLDLAGRRLWSQDGEQNAGLHAVRWNGTLEGGGRAGAGLYFVRLVTPWGTRTGRLAWLR